MMFILGTVQFGLKYGINNSVGKIELENIFEILDHASKFGIACLDTAPVYGNAEEIIGQYLSIRSNNVFTINTKFDLKNNRSLNESFEKSLSKLKVHSVDTLMFHSFGDYNIGKYEIKDFVNKYSDNYRKIGVSVYTNDELEDAIFSPYIQVIQLPFNLFDNEYQRGDLLRMAKKNKKEIHVRSVFLQGLLFIDRLKIPPQLSSISNYLKFLDSICETYNTDISTLAIQYVKNKEYIDGVIFGIDSLEQLNLNVSCFEKNIPSSVMNLIDQIAITDTELLNPSTWIIQ